MPASCRTDASAMAAPPRPRENAPNLGRIIPPYPFPSCPPHRHRRALAAPRRGHRRPRGGAVGLTLIVRPARHEGAVDNAALWTARLHPDPQPSTWCPAGLTTALGQPHGLAHLAHSPSDGFMKKECCRPDQPGHRRKDDGPFTGISAVRRPGAQASVYQEILVSLDRRSRWAGHRGRGRRLVDAGVRPPGEEVTA